MISARNVTTLITTDNAYYQELAMTKSPKTPPEPTPSQVLETQPPEFISKLETSLMDHIRSGSPPPVSLRGGVHARESKRKRGSHDRMHL